MKYPDIEANELLHTAIAAVLLNTTFDKDATAEHMYDALSDNVVYVAIERAKRGEITGTEMVRLVQAANEILWKMFRDELREEF